MHSLFQCSLFCYKEERNIELAVPKGGLGQCSDQSIKQKLSYYSMNDITRYLSKSKKSMQNKSPPKALPYNYWESRSTSFGFLIQFLLPVSKLHENSIRNCQKIQLTFPSKLKHFIFPLTKINFLPLYWQNIAKYVHKSCGCTMYLHSKCIQE